MSGKPAFNYPMFHRVAALWRAAGYEIVNPAENFDGDTSLPKPTYLRKDLAQLLECDALIVLPGWEESEGASLEVSIARVLKMPVWNSEELLKSNDKTGRSYCALCNHTAFSHPVAPGTCHALGCTCMGFTTTEKPREITESYVSPSFAASQRDRQRDSEAAMRAFEASVIIPPETTLIEANRLINGDRQAAYGHPLDDFTRTGRMWAAILGIQEVTAEQVALCMVAVKVSRECQLHKRDNLVDMAGYTGTIELIKVERHMRAGEPA